MPINSIERQKIELTKIFKKQNPFVVFLCGPSIKEKTNPGSMLRKKISRALGRNGFEVMLGEDDGMNKIARMFKLDAQTNEIKYIEKQCSAIVIIAHSAGSFSELGSFTHYLTSKDSREKRNEIDFILVVHKKYKGHKSYINHGPARLVQDCLGGLLLYVDFNKCDVSEIVNRLSLRRTVFKTSKK